MGHVAKVLVAALVLAWAVSVFYGFAAGVAVFGLIALLLLIALVLAVVGAGRRGAQPESPARPDDMRQ